MTMFVVWSRFYKTRRGVAADNVERLRYEDMLEEMRGLRLEATGARKEAHDARNEVMGVQRKMGRLEAENEECNKRADRQDQEIAALKEQNQRQATQLETQALQIASLMRTASVTRRLTDTDFGKNT